MSSKIEAILEKLRDLLAAACDAEVRLDEGLPDKIPPDGLVIIYEGDPGEPDIALGGFSSAYYQQDIEIASMSRAGTRRRGGKSITPYCARLDKSLKTIPTWTALSRAGNTAARSQNIFQPKVWHRSKRPRLS